MWWQKIFLLVIIFISSDNVVFADTYFRFDTFSYSEPVSITSTIDNWRGDFYGGEKALTKNTIESGWSNSQYKIGLLQRYDYNLEFSKDTAEFVYRIKNKIPLEIDKTYRLDINVRSTYSRGIHGQWLFPTKNKLTITAGVSLLQGLKLTEGQIKGSATTVADSDYDFEFDVDYRYSEDKLFRTETIAPSGYGYSFDLLINYNPLSFFSLNIKVEDLFGQIYWNNAPRTTAHAMSDTKTYDQDGYVVYQPTLSGKRNRQNFVQRLQSSANIKSDYTFNNKIHLISDVFYTPTKTFVRLGTKYELANNTNIHFYYMLETKAITLGITSNNSHFSITSNRLQIERATVFGLSAALSIPF